MKREPLRDAYRYGRRTEADGAFVARDRGCKRKVRYVNRRIATREAGKLGLSAYACLYCKGWHLTKQRG